MKIPRRAMALLISGSLVIHASNWLGAYLQLCLHGTYFTEPAASSMFQMGLAGVLMVFAALLVAIEANIK